MAQAGILTSQSRVGRDSRYPIGPSRCSTSALYYLADITPNRHSLTSTALPRPTSPAQGRGRITRPTFAIPGRFPCATRRGRHSPGLADISEAGPVSSRMPCRHLCPARPASLPGCSAGSCPCRNQDTTDRSVQVGSFLAGSLLCHKDVSLLPCRYVDRRPGRRDIPSRHADRCPDKSKGQRGKDSYRPPMPYVAAVQHYW